MIVVIMGVSGSGKSTIGRMLSKRLGCEFLDADDFHSADNKIKMRQGIPLEDKDRLPWLQELSRVITQHIETQKNLVLACSALKEAYRRILGESDDLAYVYLQADFQTINKRLKRRQHEFMNPQLLESQFKTLEEPHEAITVDAGQSTKQVVEQIITRLNESKQNS